eukprot:3036453-Prymnesium_polylepis.1
MGRDGIFGRSPLRERWVDRRTVRPAFAGRAGRRRSPLRDPRRSQRTPRRLCVSAPRRCAARWLHGGHADGAVDGGQRAAQPRLALRAGAAPGPRVCVSRSRHVARECRWQPDDALLRRCALRRGGRGGRGQFVDGVAVAAAAGERGAGMCRRRARRLPAAARKAQRRHKGLVCWARGAPLAARLPRGRRFGGGGGGTGGYAGGRAGGAPAQGCEPAAV